MNLGNYKGLTVQAPDLTVTEKELMRSLRHLQLENGVLTHIDDRPARTGDRAVLDFQGYVDDKPFPGARGVRYPLVLGSHSFIPGFEDQIVGRYPGETFDVSVTFPDSYPNAEIAGKKARYSVTLLSLGILELQDLDDDFALDFSEYDTLEELKDALFRSLEEKKEEAENDRIRRDLLTQVIASSRPELNEAVISEIQEEYFAELEEDIAEQSMTMEQFLKRSNQTIEKVQADCRQKAIRQFSETAVLHAVALAEGLELTEEELEDALWDMADYCETDPQTLVQSLDPQELDGLKLELLCRKAMELLLREARLISPKESGSASQ